MSNTNLHDSIVSFLVEKFPEINVDMTTPIVNFVKADSPGPLQFYIDSFVSMLEDALHVTMPDNVFDDLVLAAPSSQPITLGQAMPHLIQMVQSEVVTVPETVADPVANFEDTQIELPVLELVLEQPAVTQEQPALAAWPFPTDSANEEIDINLDENTNTTAVEEGSIITPASAWPFPIGEAPVYTLSNPVEQTDPLASELVSEIKLEESSVADTQAGVATTPVEIEVNAHAINAAYHYALKYKLEAVLSVLDTIFLEINLPAKPTKKRVKKALKSIQKGTVAPFESVTRYTLGEPSFDISPVNYKATQAAFKYALKYDLEEVLEVLDAIFTDLELSKKKSRKVIKKSLKALR